MDSETQSLIDELMENVRELNETVGVLTVRVAELEEVTAPQKHDMEIRRAIRAHRTAGDR